MARFWIGYVRKYGQGQTIKIKLGPRPPLKRQHADGWLDALWLGAPQQTLKGFWRVGRDNF